MLPRYKYIIYVLIFTSTFAYYEHHYKKYQKCLRKHLYHKTWIYMADRESNIHRTIVDTPQRSIHARVASEMRYFLFTRSKAQGEELSKTESFLKGTTFNFSAPTKIITHGWMANGHRTACASIRNAYMEHGYYNLIILDWEKLAANYVYIGAATRVSQLGEELAKFVKSLVAQGMSLKTLHLIGHSLGAHLVGITGNHFVEEKIERITGLDPASPYFDQSSTRTLTPNSANFVDVIHTATATLGMKIPLGTVDFYPNGGKTQIDCVTTLLNRFKVVNPACDHAKSWIYFTMSITHRSKYPSRKCHDYTEYLNNKCEGMTVYMGDPCNKNAKGKYYLAT